MLLPHLYPREQPAMSGDSFGCLNGVGGVCAICGLQVKGRGIWIYKDPESVINAAVIHNFGSRMK